MITLLTLLQDTKNMLQYLRKSIAIEDLFLLNEYPDEPPYAAVSPKNGWYIIDLKNIIDLKKQPDHIIPYIQIWITAADGTIRQGLANRKFYETLLSPLQSS